MLEQPAPAPTPTPLSSPESVMQKPAPLVQTPPPPNVHAESKPTTLCARRLDPSDAAAVSEFLAEVGHALGKLGPGSVQVALVRQENGE